MLAQIPTSTAGEIGFWLIPFAGVMGIYWLARQIYLSHFPIQRDEDRYVTHAQFDSFKVEVKLELNDFKRELKADMEKGALSTRGEIKELDRYTRDSFHRAQGAQQHMLTDLAFLRGVMVQKPARKPADEDAP